MKKKLNLVTLSENQQSAVRAGAETGGCGEPFGCGCWCPDLEICVSSNRKRENPDCIVPPE